jgi:hypothetical protein
MSQALSCRMLAPVAMLLDTPTCAHKLELSLRVGIACDKGVPSGNSESEDHFRCGGAVLSDQTLTAARSMSASKQPPTRPKRQPLAHLRPAAFRQYLAESGWSALDL